MLRLSFGVCQDHSGTCTSWGVQLAIAAMSWWVIFFSSIVRAESQVNIDPTVIEQIDVRGLRYTKEATILGLLPRPIPGGFTRAELQEFERRIRNLSLFDYVKVTVQDHTLDVEVLEKVTVAPILNFSSGSSLKDSSVTGGVVEYNVGGSGTQVGAQFNYSQRGPNAEVWISQHSFHPARWAKEAELSYNVNGFRFEHAPTTWDRRRFGGEFELKGPYYDRILMMLLRFATKS